MNPDLDHALIRIHRNFVKLNRTLCGVSRINRSWYLQRLINCDVYPYIQRVRSFSCDAIVHRNHPKDYSVFLNSRILDIEFKQPVNTTIVLVLQYQIYKKWITSYFPYNHDIMSAFIQSKTLLPESVLWRCLKNQYPRVQFRVTQDPMQMFEWLRENMSQYDT